MPLLDKAVHCHR